MNFKMRNTSKSFSCLFGEKILKIFFNSHIFMFSQCEVYEIFCITWQLFHEINFTVNLFTKEVSFTKNVQK